MSGFGELYGNIFVFLGAVVLLQASLALTAFSTGLSSTGLNTAFLIRERRYILASTAIRNVIGPLIALAAARSFRLEPAVALTIAALTLTPVPLLIPVRLLRLRDANELPALCTCQMLLAMILLPFTLKLLGAALGHSVHLGYLMNLLFLPVVAPLAAGLAVKTLWRNRSEDGAGIFAVAAAFALFFALCITLLAGSPPNQLIMRLIVLGLIGIAAVHALCSEPPHRRIFRYCIAASAHPALALVVGASVFPSRMTAVAATVLICSVVQVLLVAAYMRRPEVMQRPRAFQARAAG